MDRRTGFPALAVVPVTDLQRLEHVVPDFEDLSDRLGLYATPTTVPDSPRELPLQLFFVNAFFPWTGGCTVPMPSTSPTMQRAARTPCPCLPLHPLAAGLYERLQLHVGRFAPTPMREQQPPGPRTRHAAVPNTRSTRRRAPRGGLVLSL